MESLGPFGFGFPEPIFSLKDANLINLTYSRDKKHIITNINPTLKLIGFNFDQEIVEKNTYTFEGF